jgi:hypothetical protein
MSDQTETNKPSQEPKVEEKSPDKVQVPSVPTNENKYIATIVTFNEFRPGGHTMCSVSITGRTPVTKEFNLPIMEAMTATTEIQELIERAKVAPTHEKKATPTTVPSTVKLNTAPHSPMTKTKPKPSELKPIEPITLNGKDQEKEIQGPSQKVDQLSMF